jgi:hypothetical protein
MSALTPIPTARMPGWEPMVATAVNRLQAGHKNVVSVSAAHTAAMGEDVLLGDATGAAFTVTLPPAAQYKGLQFIIKKVDASANAVTIDGAGSETIDGAATLDLASQYDSATVISDGTGWHVI